MDIDIKAWVELVILIVGMGLVFLGVIEALLKWTADEYTEELGYDAAFQDSERTQDRRRSGWC